MAAATKAQHSKLDPQVRVPDSSQKELYSRSQQINPGLEVVFPTDDQSSPKGSIKVEYDLRIWNRQNKR